MAGTDRVFVEKSGLDQCFKDIEKQMGALEAAAKSIDSVMTTKLGNHWGGDSYNKCMETYNEQYKKQLSKDVPEMVKSLNEYIKSCKEEIINLDARLAGKG